MSSLNKVMLIGNLCADPETRAFQNGGTVCNLRIATNETWKDKETGERREKAEFHSVAIFSEGLAKVAEQYLRKGSRVYVEGKLQTRKWQDQSGNDRYSTEVVLQGFGSTLVMLDGRQGDSSGPRESGRPDAEATRQQRAYEAQKSGDLAQRDLDDCIPF